MSSAPHIVMVKLDIPHMAIILQEAPGKNAGKLPFARPLDYSRKRRGFQYFKYGKMCPAG